MSSQIVISKLAMGVIMITKYFDQRQFAKGFKNPHDSLDPASSLARPSANTQDNSADLLIVTVFVVVCFIAF